MEMLPGLGDDESVVEAQAKEVMCEVCGKDIRKYKCPRCGVSTCSLQCCKTHKTKTECSGKRERIQFVATSEMTEKTLKQDYHFLEDVLQTRVGAKRNFNALCVPGQEKKPPKPSSGSVLQTMAPAQNLAMYGKGVKILVRAAGERGTKILLQPPGMSKRNQNSSRYDQRQDAIHWKLAAVFILRDDFQMSQILSLDVNSQQLDQVKALNAPAICLFINQALESTTVADLRAQLLTSIPSGTLLRQAVKPLLSQLGQLKCFLRVLPSQADNPLFRNVDAQTTLRDALGGMTVIEFPTLFFAPPGGSSKMRLLVDDPVVVLPPRSKIMELEDEQDEIEDADADEESEEEVEEDDLEDDENQVHEMETESDDDSSEDEDEDEEATILAKLPLDSAMDVSVCRGPASDKKVSFGGMLIADYGSSDDESGEVEPIPLPPNASSKYHDFMQQLLAQPAAVGEAVASAPVLDDLAR